jgi:hypothetical protein
MTFREMDMLGTSLRMRRLVASSLAAFALLSLVIACDDSGQELTSANPGAAGSGGARGGSDTGGSDTGGSDTGGSNPGGSDTTSAQAGSRAVSDAAGAAGSGGGARLARYHRADTDRSLAFELDSVDGLSPYPSSIDYLTTLVGRVLPKPDGIVFDNDETLPPFGEEHVWTFNELDEFSRLHAADDSRGPVSIHVLLVDGRYDSGDDSGTVLGLAWGQRYIALFQDAIRSGCSGVLGPLQTESCEVAERSVWAHELGHVIGLVDNGLPQQTPHRDPDHGRHDVDDGCLMNWVYESPALFETLVSRLETGQSPDVDFCENCWADLNAAHD